MFGLEEYYIGLLNEAKSPEEIKKILEYQFVEGKGVPKVVLDKVFKIDPTKKKSFTRWTLSQWENAKEKIIESLNNGMLERMFKTFKERQNSGLDLTNMKSFDEAMEKVPEVDPVLEKDGDPNSPENNFDIVYTSEDGTWIVAQPHTYEADKKLGRGCKWCTAGAFGDNPYYWNAYSSKGPLWVNFDKTKHEVCPMDNKEYPYKRYQLLFEYNNWQGELMDCHDWRINPEDIDMPEDVIEFYGTKNERYAEILKNGVSKSEESLWQQYNDERVEMAREIFSTRGGNMALYLLPERNDDRRLEDVPWHVYHQDDFADPVSSTEYDPDDCVELELESEEIVVLRDTHGEYHAYTCQQMRHWEEYDDVFLAPIKDMYSWCLLSFNDGLIIAPTNENEIASYIDIEKQLRFRADVVAGFANKQISNVMSEAGDHTVGTYIEVVWDDGSHTLLFKKTDDDDIDFVIKRDFPTGESSKMFMANIEDRKVIVHGRLFSHDIMDASTGIMMDADISEECGKPVYVVRYNETDNLNVYDATTKKMFFNFQLGDVETISIGNESRWYLRCTTPGERNAKTFIASTQDGKILTGMYDSMRRAAWQSPFIVAQNNNEMTNNHSIIYLIVFNKGNCRTYGPFASCAALDSTDRIVVRPISGGVNILNAETGELMLNDDIKNWGKLGGSTFGDDEGMMVLQDINDNFSLYDYENSRMIVPNIDIRRDGGGVVKPMCGQNHVWTIKMPGEKYNLVKNKRLVLPKNVDKVYRNPDGMNVNAVLDGNKMWFVTVDDEGNAKLLPSGAGVDITNLEIVGQGDGKFRFYFKPSNGCVYEVDYYPDMHGAKSSKPGITVMKLGNQEGTQKEYVSEQDPVYRAIYSTFFPVAAAVRENFNKTLKMISEFYNKD